MKKRFFVIPQNDAETVAIRDLLSRAGFRLMEDLFITHQGRDASWDNLEDVIRRKIHARVCEGMEGYGVELRGKAPEGCSNIDHHCYEDDIRFNDLSSLEQVAELLGVELSTFERYVVANDNGSISYMRQLEYELGLTELESRDIEDVVRRMDRAAQGITPLQEKQAEVACKYARKEGALTTVCLEHSKCTTVTDRLYGQYQNLAIFCDDGKVEFYGAPAICEQLLEKFGGRGIYGFWCHHFERGSIQGHAEVLEYLKSVT